MIAGGDPDSKSTLFGASLKYIVSWTYFPRSYSTFFFIYWNFVNKKPLVSTITYDFNLSNLKRIIILSVDIGSRHPKFHMKSIRFFSLTYNQRAKKLFRVNRSTAVISRKLKRTSKTIFYSNDSGRLYAHAVLRHLTDRRLSLTDRKHYT